MITKYSIALNPSMQWHSCTQCASWRTSPFVTHIQKLTPIVVGVPRESLSCSFKNSGLSQSYPLSDLSRPKHRPIFSSQPLDHATDKDPPLAKGL